MSVAQKLFEGNSPAKSGSTGKITCQKGQMCAHRENKGLATIPTGVELFAIGQSTSVMHGALLTPLWEVLAIPSLQNRSLDTHFCSILIQTSVLSLCSIFDGFFGHNSQVAIQFVHMDHMLQTVTVQLVCAEVTVLTQCSGPDCSPFKKHAA
jgi:hypothetical protein